MSARTSPPSVATHLRVRCTFAVLRALAHLPWRVLYAFGITLGEIAHWLHAPRRAIARRNIAACFPQLSTREVHSLARRHFHQLGAAVFSAALVWHADFARLQRLTRIVGADKYNAARRDGVNIIVLAPHFVGLEYGGVFLSGVHPMLSMYRRHPNAVVHAQVTARRARFGNILYAHNAAPKSMIKQLRNARQFYYLPDQDAGKRRGIFAPFFNIAASTYPTLGRIAKLGNATVFPCATKILPRGRGFEICFDEPLPDYPCGDEMADVVTMNRAIEQLIRHAPAQYFWAHRRFKTRPPGEAKFYK